MTSRPTLFMICGLPGAGKTTLSRQLEMETNGLRLSPDEWISILSREVSDQPEMDRLRTAVETLQWDLAQKVLKLGVNVILENGFWSRAERRRFRSQAKAMGARVELHFLEVERDELWRRLVRRNANPPSGTWVVTEAQLNLWWSLFQAPDEEEMNSFDRNKGTLWTNKNKKSGRFYTGIYRASLPGI